jgi:phage/plasmid-like protein (TIGR03299 family)
MSEHVKTLEELGLNWNVSKEPIQTVAGVAIPDKVAIMRTDNQAVLGIHGDKYDPYQNHELLELLHKIGGHTGLQIHSGGSFNGGGKVWFQLKSDDLKLGGDTVKGFISGFNSFDGSSSLGFGNSTKTVSCKNTWWAAYREVNTKLRHSASMRSNLDEILQKIDIVLDEEQEIFKEIVMLSETAFNQVQKDLVTQLLFNLSTEDMLGGEEELSTRKQNQIEAFEKDLRIEVDQKGDNLWGLFSGVTRYTTHSMKKTDNTQGKMFGQTGVKERRIFKELVEMV